ncbi:MAG: LytTR family DNA-binding domain-containing protein [Opitutaceae bacterium]
MRILIVEDEAVVARRLEQFCRRILATRLEWLRLAETLDAAQAALAESPIDLLLLDLNLGGRNGMALLESNVAGSFHTIIVSANTEHALLAFERGVIDFVAKPFTEQRLAEALRRVSEPDGRSPHAARFLAVRKQGRIALVPIDDVLYVQGADDCSELVLADGRRELHDKTLEKLQALLPPVFERIHKSYLVRLSAVRALHVHEGSRYEAELKNGAFLPVGRTRYKEIRESLG